ncbi:MAG: sigma-54-dependent Fis family transcriptional regulator [Candidatus Tectomicrobia bacterium]|uniref:Sigma-54-dependent Fis family transcriptional regulator n=1 Tax=Tectimicrobiota bacterium TaxID=2528274 RepID=A0A933GKZ3_UNCTE|nr:sigma-54-dependent Fis family transcriptional regulator [Candidatus Tectomicrobia bacterium]
MNLAISVLIVDDEETFRTVLAKELTVSGFKVTACSNGEEACQAAVKEEFDVVLLDLKMPGMDGIEVLRHIKDVSPLTEVIILTGHGTIDNAINSMKLGAYDYLSKPCKLNEVEAVIIKAYEKRGVIRQNIILKEGLSGKSRFQGIIGKGPQILELLAMIDRVAPTDSMILVQGESGTGKELVARAIHFNSHRRNNPFVVVDCASLQEHLLQSELFGHEKGAFTGAITLKHGLFEVADTGTLFMDEIGELSPLLQVQLLRVLETGSFRRVGGTRDLAVDVRIVAATNRNLEKMMEEGRFREDLFFRLNVINIHIPPLRARTEDIPLLANHFLENYPRKLFSKKKISSEALKILLEYHWPGNIRELKNAIERAAILSEDEFIKAKDLPGSILDKKKIPLLEGTNTYPSLREIEENYINILLKEFKGHRAKVAQVLGISERNLYRKLKEYNLDG